jgi:hypothetical protein
VVAPYTYTVLEVPGFSKMSKYMPPPLWTRGRVSLTWTCNHANMFFLSLLSKYLDSILFFFLNYQFLSDSLVFIILCQGYPQMGRHPDRFAVRFVHNTRIYQNVQVYHAGAHAHACNPKAHEAHWPSWRLRHTPFFFLSCTSLSPTRTIGVTDHISRGLLLSKLAIPIFAIVFISM